MAFLGIVDDGVDIITSILNHHLNEYKYDIILSTGAVSTKKFDLIPASLSRSQFLDPHSSGRI